MLKECVECGESATNDPRRSDNRRIIASLLWVANGPPMWTRHDMHVATYLSRDGKSFIDALARGRLGGVMRMRKSAG